jgi:putative ABC transport system permease protein
MIKNYLKTAFRSFKNNKAFFSINVIGLAIGISASLVIYLIVSYDFSFDKFEPASGRIYRVVNEEKDNDNDFKSSGVPLPMVIAAQQATGVELFVPFSLAGEMSVKINLVGIRKPNSFKNQDHIIYADGNYFKFIPYKWMAGSALSALKEPKTIVLTQSRSKIYFPNKEVQEDIGKTIVYDDTVVATVTGIVADLQQPTDFTFKEFISYSTLPANEFKANNWGSQSSSDQLLIKLYDGINPSTVQKQLQGLSDKNHQNAYTKTIYSLQPLNNIHFNSEFDNFGQRGASLPVLYGLLIVAAILLLLGSINFINLTTAQAVQKAKEIGIRKILGSTKRQLIFQFLGEAFLHTFFAAILSVILVPLIINLFSDFIPKAISTRMLLQTNVIIFITALIIIVSVFSGFYPALILSGYNPVQALKNLNLMSGSTRKAWIRKSLTVTQFVFAQAFVIAAIIAGFQLRYVLTKDLGFRKNGIITISTPAGDHNDSNTLKKLYNTKLNLIHTLQTIPGIDKVALGSLPASNGSAMEGLRYNNGSEDIKTMVEVKYGDEEYFKLFNISLVAGRYPIKNDSLREYVINECYSKLLGFKNPQDAIGRMIKRGKRQFPIVGVVRNFYAKSLRSMIKPLVIYVDLFSEDQIHIALKPETDGTQWQNTITRIQGIYKNTYPDENFTYTFFDESIAKFYESEQHMSTLLSWSTALAIIISCLGLLGLVTYITNQRTKEIGIRKVLGANVLQIVYLISKDFLKLVLLAFIIAAPIVWWGMNKWFENFAYHTNISPSVFIAAGLIMILVATATLSFQTINAAIKNPVESLKTE